MAADLEDQKKAILPFLQRAQEVQKADPKVAYYCRLYGVEQAMKLPHRAKEINAVLAAALGTLEKEKAKLDLDPAADRIYCLGFALRIFDNADRADRAGKATENTAKAFYAASVFMEILNHFEGGVDAELFEKQRYCVWRAAEIRKALREGRQPTPPPAAEPPAAAAAASGSGSGSQSDLSSLPPASGSSDWAYGGSSVAHQAPPQPPPLSSSPTPPLQTLASGGSSAGGEGGAAAAAGGSGTGRMWPGCRLLVRIEEGLEDGDGDGEGHSPAVQTGTVGQVLRRPDGGISYKVALRDRLVEVPDEAAVPELAEGAPAALRAQPGGPPLPATVLLVNDASWPPSYLVKTADGRELAATAQQLGPPVPAGALPPAAAPTAPPPHPGTPPGPPLVVGSPLATSLGRGASPTPPPPPSLPPLARPPLASPPMPPPPQAPVGPSAPLHSAGSGPYPSVSGAHYTQPQQQQQQPQPQPGQGYSRSAAWPLPAAAAAPPPALPPGYKPPLKAISDAQKQAKYAVSALSFEDIPTAVKHLSEALQLLTDPHHAAHAGRR